jgi:hypothetical protein
VPVGGREVDELQDETTAAVESIIRQLAAVDACLTSGTDPGWAEADQVRFLRVFVEEGIAEMARADDVQFDFLVECVTQASENMQDARIDVVEQRVDEAAEGEQDSLADFFVTLGFVLALEILVVSTATYAVPALVALAAARAQARRARQLVTVIGHRESLVAEQKAASQALAAFAERVAESRQARDALRPTPESHWTSYTAHRRAIRSTRAIENEYAVALAALERGEGVAKRADDAVQAAIGQQTARRLASPALQDFQDKTLQHVAMHRVAENVATSLTEKVVGAAVAAGPDAPGPFRTDTLVSTYLAEIRRQRNEAGKEWALTRLHVRCLSDADFLESQVSHELFLRIHAGPAAALALDRTLQDRDFLVRGIEAALWLAWLRHTKALGAREVSGRRIPPPSLDNQPREGRVYGSLFIKDLQAEAGPDVGEPIGDNEVKLLAAGTVLPGLASLTDQHASYLYRQFARPFFVRNPKRAPSPLVFDDARYVELGAMPERPGFLGQDRRDRVAETKLLVITFFQLMESDPSLIGGTGDPVGDEGRKALRSLFEIADEDDVVRGYFGLLPPVSEPDEAAIEAATPPDELPTSLDPAALVRDARDALRKLGDMATDLDLLILQAPPPTSFDERDMATRSGDEAFLQEIERARDAVVDQWHVAQELSTDVPAVRAELYDTYEKRVAGYMAWPEPVHAFVGPVAP